MAAHWQLGRLSLGALKLGPRAWLPMTRLFGRMLRLMGLSWVGGYLASLWTGIGARGVGGGERARARARGPRRRGARRAVRRRRGDRRARRDAAVAERAPGRAAARAAASRSRRRSPPAGPPRSASASTARRRPKGWRCSSSPPDDAPHPPRALLLCLTSKPRQLQQVRNQRLALARILGEARAIPALRGERARHQVAEADDEDEDAGQRPGAQREARPRAELRQVARARDPAKQPALGNAIVLDARRRSPRACAAAG